MNCQELTALLDDGDLRNLRDAKRRELDTHLSECADCAAEWRVQERIVMTPTMQMPAGFVVQCRQLVAADAARFVRRRAFLYSTVLVLAAVAALLVWRMWTPSVRSAVVAAAPVLAPPVQAPSQVQPEPKSIPKPAKSQPVALPPAMFTVAVRPLQIEGSDTEGNAIAVRFRDRVMALLQGVPNLVLVDAQSSADTVAADIEVRMKYTGPGSSVAPISRTVDLDIKKPSEFAATEAAIAAEATMSPADQLRSRVARQGADFQKRRSSLSGGNTGLRLLLGSPSPTLAIIDEKISPQPDTLEFSAQQLVRELRTKVLPLDPSFEQHQLAVLGDPAQKYGMRWAALGALLSYAERRGGFSHLSPAEVRAGGEFALTAQTDVALKLPVIWDGLALTASPALVPYLIRGLDEIPQTETRLQLVRILAEKFGDDPRARTALAAAAKSNDQQTVRMAALRESGDPQWSAYVVATLMNNTLPDLQRLQPIADMAPGETATLGTSPKTKLVLEDNQLRELETVIARLAPDSTASEVVRKALFAAGAMDTPAALDMLIDILHTIRTEDFPNGLPGVSVMGMRSTARQLIAFRYSGDPKARAVIAEVANSSSGLENMEAQMELRTMDMQARAEKIRQDQQSVQPQAQ